MAEENDFFSVVLGGSRLDHEGVSRFVRKGWERLGQFTPSGFHLLSEVEASSSTTGVG